MRISIVKEFDELSSKAAAFVEQQMLTNSHSVLGLATGSTPLGLYQKMIEGYVAGSISYQNVKTINLDEYWGLGKKHSQSYYSFMYENLFKHINVSLDNTHLPNGRASSPERECDRYEKLLDTIGPPDLQILGMGTNGHIGFNEPGTRRDSMTHLVALDRSTRENNSRFFNSLEEVPTHAITLGISSILKSRQILLLVAGESKAEAMKQLMMQEVSEAFPASFLWEHPNVTVIADRAACSLIETDITQAIS